ncbi:hypothetical protein FEM48_Zijuj11G0151200 [Ziziphus jujuba var. spinosa]|uniref:Uncharacterized protein n=1 Tax=Ziziphus jujuba var. spinosa TaxID=714518 RepID=A0A978UJN2_ZIZJJ|nr:hypothetical protein FEM48_Zijuj11G0151200 [Ziziphus jujuba var. spinosa]
MVNGVHFFTSRSLDMLDPLQLSYLMIYIEIREGYSIHDDMSRKLRKFDLHYSSAELNGCYSTVITGYSDVIDSNNRIFPIFERIMILKNALI